MQGVTSIAFLRWKQLTCQREAAVKPGHFTTSEKKAQTRIASSEQIRRVDAPVDGKASRPCRSPKLDAVAFVVELASASSSNEGGDVRRLRDPPPSPMYPCFATGFRGGSGRGGHRARPG